MPVLAVCPLAIVVTVIVGIVVASPLEVHIVILADHEVNGMIIICRIQDKHG